LFLHQRCARGSKPTAFESIVDDSGRVSVLGEGAANQLSLNGRSYQHIQIVLTDNINIRLKCEGVVTA